MKEKIIWIILLFLSTVCGAQVDSVAVRQVDSLLELTKGLTNRKEFKKAFEVCYDAESLALEKFGRMSPEYGACCFNLGRIHFFEGNPLESECWYLESKEIRLNTLGFKNPDYAWTLHNLASLYHTLGRFIEAEKYYLESKSIRTADPGKLSSNYLQSLNNLAVLYKDIGRFDVSEDLYKESRHLRSKTLGTESPEYALCLNNLANLYYQQGRYFEAEILYFESKKIYAKNPGQESPSYARSLINLGSLYNDLGRYKEAEQLHQESILIRTINPGKESIEYARSLINLGELYITLGRFPTADSILSESIKIFEKRASENNPDYATNLLFVARLYDDMNKYAQAEELFLKAKSIYKKNPGDNSPLYATNLLHLASFYTKLSRFDEAKGLYNEVKVIYQKNPGIRSPQYASVLNEMAYFYYKTNNFRQSEVFKDSAIYLVQDLLSKAVLFSSEKDMSDYLRKEKNKLIDIPSFMYLRNYSDAMECLSYNTIIFQKGYLQTVARRLNLLTSKKTSSDSLSQLLRSHRFALSEAYSKNSLEGNYISQLEKKANDLERQLAREVAGYADALRQIKWQEVQSALKPEEAAIEFLRFPVLLPKKSDSILYAALVLRPGIEAPLYVPLCEERELTARLQKQSSRTKEYVDALYSTASRGLMPAQSREGRDLYQLLWQPLEQALRGVQKIYFANAGLLHRINAGAITVPGDSTLSTRYHLVQLGSTRSVVLPNTLSSASQNTLVMGGIEYEADTTALQAVNAGIDSISYAVRGELRFVKPDSTAGMVEYWPYLKPTLTEAGEITKTVKRSGMKVLNLSGLYASEETFYKAVKSEGISPRIIHLATHGYFYPDPKEDSLTQRSTAFKMSDHPLVRSGLILAGGNHAWQTGEPIKPGMADGILTAYEISQLNLSDTELVVLSACETGLGDIEGNEGVYGLQRAFQIAGVKYLIMSLWKVDDKKTVPFMTTFYRKWLEEKLPVPEAFRRTQDEMRQKYEGDPYDWAGFVLVE